MAELNPITLWKRLLAMPNDSRTKTLVMAFLVSAVCAVLVSGATVVLRPIQAANRAAEQQLRLETMLAAIPGMREVMAEADGGALTTVVVNLETGQAAEEVTPATLDEALEEPANWTQLSPEEDTAAIGARPDLAQIYLLRDGDDVSLAVFPIMGAGYVGPLTAMLAMRGDMTTIAGMTVTSQEETPGLGARIEEPAWQASFAGTRVRDEQGNIRFNVARGPASGAYEVDGITGATRTSNAVARMVRFWVGPNGYGKVMDAIRRGEF